MEEGPEGQAFLVQVKHSRMKAHRSYGGEEQECRGSLRGNVLSGANWRVQHAVTGKAMQDHMPLDESRDTGYSWPGPMWSPLPDTFSSLFHLVNAFFKAQLAYHLFSRALLTTLYQLETTFICDHNSGLNS